MKIKTLPEIKNQIRGQDPPASNLVAIAGGKGGVGKSFISSSIAVFLANMGYKTILIDLDLGAANLHTVLGESHNPKGINEFLKSPELPLAEVISKTSIPNLELISGSSDFYDSANIDGAQKSRLLSSIYHLKADYVLMDLSAGSHLTTLDLFLMAQRHLLVVTPEPSSVENAYRFLKASFYRRIKRFEYQLGISGLVADIMKNRKEYNVRVPADMLRIVAQNDPVNGYRLSELMEQFEVDIILNQCRSGEDREVGPSVQSVSRRYFGTSMQYLGYVDYDNAVWRSLRRRKHLLIDCPQSQLYTQLMRISRQLAKQQTFKAVV